MTWVIFLSVSFSQQQKENMTFQSSVSLPYIGPALFKIARILREVGIQVNPYEAKNRVVFIQKP